MLITLAAAVSIDGKIKHAERIHTRDWISKEDKTYFKSLLANCDVVVMGRKTYQSMHLRSAPTRPYIILTRNPLKYRARNTFDTVEFTNAKPRELVERLSKLAECDNLLLVGGRDIYTAFLKENLVDQLHITIEPILLGAGIPFFDTAELKIRLHLLSLQQLNACGTLLLKMKVAKIL